MAKQGNTKSGAQSDYNSANLSIRISKEVVSPVRAAVDESDVTLKHLVESFLMFLTRDPVNACRAVGPYLGLVHAEKLEAAIKAGKK